jgi:hypothetical protein
MSFVTAQPALLTAASADLQGIGAMLNSQTAAAATPTTGVLPAGTDSVSVLTAARFNAQAVSFQQISAEAAAVHEMFVQTLRQSGGLYAVTEAANANGFG